jgi:hypothetical protein
MGAACDVDSRWVAVILRFAVDWGVNGVKKNILIYVVDT